MTTHLAHSLVERFPASLVSTAQAAIAKAYEKLVRAADKAGVTAPAAPTLTVIKEYIHNGSSTGEGGVETTFSMRVVDLEIVYARPALDGWEFLAVLEPLTSGNYVRAFPGAAIADGELDRFYLSKMTCDHCRTNRQRAEVFVVRNAAGEHKQVGSTCVEAFLGGKSAAAIVAALAWPKIIATVGEGEGGGVSEADLVLPRVDFLTLVSACVRGSGWLSSGKARETGGQSTASLAWFLSQPPRMMDKARHRKDSERNPIVAADRTTAEAAIAWALALTGTSDYEKNLRIVMGEEFMSRKHAGIVASAIAGYNRMLGQEQAKKATDRAPSVHVGALGERVTATVTLEKLASFDSEYGAVVIHTFRDDVGNAFVWKTGRTAAQIGERVKLRGTVKKHDEFRGEKQTVVSRCDLFDDAPPLTAETVTDAQIAELRDSPKLAKKLVAACDAAIALDMTARAKVAAVINARNGHA